MGNQVVSFRVSDAERRKLLLETKQQKLSLSDLVRKKLAIGSDVEEASLPVEEIAQMRRRLQVLEAQVLSPLSPQEEEPQPPEILQDLMVNQTSSAPETMDDTETALAPDMTGDTETSRDTWLTDSEAFEAVVREGRFNAGKRDHFLAWLQHGVNSGSLNVALREMGLTADIPKRRSANPNEAVRWLRLGPRCVTRY